MTIALSLDMFLEQNARNLDENVHGALSELITAQPLNNGAPINVTAGIGKIVFVPQAGIMPTGVITFTGDTVDRMTGAVTVGDTEDITLAGLATDASSNDAEGNHRHSLTDAYITSKWFMDTVAISTVAGVSVSNCDVYQCSFEQFNDSGDSVELDTFDLNLLCNNNAGWFYGYIYSVIVSGVRVNVTREASIEVRGR